MLPPEANLMAVTHYLEALDFQKEIVKIHTIFGGKNPHPNWLVGGVPCAINLDGTGAVGAINMERLNMVVEDHRRHHRVHQQRLHPRPARHRHPSTRTGLLSAAASRARTCSPTATSRQANDDSSNDLLMPRGAIINGNLNEILPVDLSDPEQIQEFVTTAGTSTPTRPRACTPGTA